MSKLVIPITACSRTLYIRVPKNAADASSVELPIEKGPPKDIYLKVEILSNPCTEIPVNSGCAVHNCKDCQVHYCPIFQGYAELHELND